MALDTGQRGKEKPKDARSAKNDAQDESTTEFIEDHRVAPARFRFDRVKVVPRCFLRPL